MDSRFKRIALLCVISLALVIIIVDTTVLNVSIANLITDLHTDIQSINWVISIYALVLASLTITGGRLGDLYGRKKMFVIGAVIFAIGSLIASFSENINTLLFGWSMLEGLGAALMMPATTSLLITNFHGKSRAIAFGVFGGIAGAAAAFGPIFGGYITTYASWHWALRINVVIVMILIAGSTIIKESHDTKEKKQLDIIGVILSSIALLLIVFGIIEAGTYGWLLSSKPFEIFGQAINLAGISITPIATSLGLILLIVFGIWENKTEKNGHTPLVSLSLFQNRQFTSGAIVTLILAMGQSGIIFAVPVFVQSVLKLNALETGIVLLPMSLSLLFAAPISAVLGRKIAPKIIVFIGLFLNLIALIILYYSITVTATAQSLIIGLLVYGIGMGLIMAQINNITLSAVETYKAGEASGVSAMLRQVGSSFGSAIIGAIFMTTFTTSMVASVNNSKVLPEPAKQTIVNVVDNSGSNLEFGDNKNLAGNNVPQFIKDEITNVINSSTVDGNKQALVITGFIALIGIGAAFLLPNKMLESKSQDTVAVGH